ncbi:MAG TPA: energy transducer TonB [Ignavibacteriales bacterium]|nr:energy transducer TonB [Ignavibacteriales bacterium]
MKQMIALLTFLILFSIMTSGQTDSCECKRLNDFFDKKYQSGKATHEDVGVQALPFAAYSGGQEELIRILGNHPYPEEAVKNKIEGNVLISVIVDTLGNLNCYKVARDIGYGCGQAALNYLKELNLKFIPAIEKIDGKERPVSQRIMIVFHFRL